MRTIEEIKKEATSLFMGDVSIQKRFELPENAVFEDHFKAGSVINILFYIFACVTWVHERIVSQFMSDTLDEIAEMKPHGLRWYRNKTLMFRYGQELLPESDVYGDTGKSPQEIAEMQVVKYCAVSEALDVSKLFIKVAGVKNGVRSPISAQEQEALEAYLLNVRDAGVHIELVNRDADKLKVNIEIHYDPMVLNSDGNATNGEQKPVIKAIENYIANLPFNGEYRNVDLVDVLQKVPGVVIPELSNSEWKFGDNDYQVVPARCRPDAGYFELDKTQSAIRYIPYESAI